MSEAGNASINELPYICPGGACSSSANAIHSQSAHGLRDIDCSETTGAAAAVAAAAINNDCCVCKVAAACTEPD